MKTLHLSVSLSRSAGGIFEIQLAVARHLQSLAVDVEVFGLVDDHWPLDAPRWGSIPTEAFATLGPRKFGYAPRLLQKMVESNADIAHLHYIWMFPSIAVSKWGGKTRRPYVVTPNGMLEPWALNNSAWKKKIAGVVYENRMLRGAACLQANTVKELQDFRAYGLKNPVCVIPNGMEMPEVNAETLKAERLQYERKTLLFLGRLHPKKGLVNALRAWAKIRSQGAGVKNQDDWQFVIAGWDQGGHEADLKRLCTELALAYADVPAADFVADDRLADLSPPSSVVFTGPAFGADKAALLQRASAFILPSFSEGLPMSVLEAWSYGLPVLMTDHCNLPDGFAANAALRIGTDVESIAAGLQALLSLPCPSLVAMGDAGRTLVERQFTWPRIAAQMKEVYEWVLGGGSKPECVME